MLIYALYVAGLVLIVVAVWLGWHLLRGRKPPEVQSDGKGPAPSDRDERWDPRSRYGDAGDPGTGGQPR